MPLLPSPSPAWIVGPVTLDEVAGSRIPGGTALYTARASEALNVRAYVLTTGGADADLAALSGHEAHVVEAQTLTLRHEFLGHEFPGHEFPGGHRVQTLLQSTGRMLVPEDAPTDWPAPETLILAPLLSDDVDVAAFVDEYPGAEVAVIAQGLQRAVLPDGRIANRAQPSSVLFDVGRPNVSIFLAEEETALWAAGTVEHLAARCARVVVTHGSRGATVYSRSGSREIAPAPAEVVDATGAGDVFACAFILAVRAGEEFAGRVAAACAAAAVEVRGPGALPSLTEIEARFDIRHPLPPAGQGSADGGASA